MSTTPRSQDATYRFPPRVFGQCFDILAETGLERIHRRLERRSSGKRLDDAAAAAARCIGMDVGVARLNPRSNLLAPLLPCVRIARAGKGNAELVCDL